MRLLVEFQKTSTVRHLGLLDLQRTMQRCLRRSNLPVAYSNGFNPHMIMSFASALSSGISSEAEILEVSLSEHVTEFECIDALTRVLPYTLPLKRVRLVNDQFPKLGAIMSCSEFNICTGSIPDSAKIIQSIEYYLDQKEIMEIKKTKTREDIVNIRPMIVSLKGDIVADSHVSITTRLSYNEKATLKPTLLIKSLSSYLNMNLGYINITRTNLYALKNENLVPLFEYE